MAIEKGRNPPRPAPSGNPWGNAQPKAARPDKRERERIKAAGTAPSAPASTRTDYADSAGARPPTAQQRHEELRLFGINACRAAFVARPDDLRKVYLTEERIPAFKAVLAWCAKHKLGYRVVEANDLAKLTASQHHEGVCFELRRQVPLSIAALLALQPPAPAPALLVVLDGVGNPHNFGAVLRSAANFAVGGMLVPVDSSLTLSGAACRVAEGGAEVVPLARAEAGDDVLRSLRDAGFAIAATVPRGGDGLYAKPLPARLALVFGAESEGMSEGLITAADHKLTIPGTGAVESLNIASSAAVVFAEHYRQHRS